MKLTEPRTSNVKMMTRIATNGGYQFCAYVSCDVGQHFSSYQDIVDFPFQMNTEYFKELKPMAYLRTWFASEDGRDIELSFGLKLSFFKEENEVNGKSLGGSQKYIESDTMVQEFIEIMYHVDDLHSFDFDKIRYFFNRLLNIRPLSDIIALLT